MTDSRKQRLISALRQHKGIVSTACRAVTVPRRTFYHWLHTDRRFREQVEDIGEEAIDFAESKLMEKIDEGSERSIIFYLKTRGKRRGYSEQTDMSVSDVMDKHINALVKHAFNLGPSPFVDFNSTLTDEDRESLSHADADAQNALRDRL